MITGYKWELYNLNEDVAEYNDLAAKMPDKLEEMRKILYVEAGKYDVLPLNNSTLARFSHVASERDGRAKASHIRAC